MADPTVPEIEAWRAKEPEWAEEDARNIFELFRDHVLLDYINACRADPAEPVMSMAEWDARARGMARRFFAGQR